jgi:hypothetical protein
MILIRTDHPYLRVRHHIGDLMHEGVDAFLIQHLEGVHNYHILLMCMQRIASKVDEGSCHSLWASIFNMKRRWNEGAGSMGKLAIASGGSC